MECTKCKKEGIDKWHLCEWSDLESLKIEAINEKRWCDAAKLRDWQKELRRSNGTYI